MDNPKGNCIGISDLNWETKELIGQGKFGSVYKTEWTTYDEEGYKIEYTVALKWPTGVTKTTIFAERDIKAQLWHENIVNILGFAQPNYEQQLVLVFDYTEEGNVLDYIWRRCEEGTPPTAETMMGMALDIAKGMEYLHSNSYVHGDLALRNCIIEADGNVKVGDLGLYEDSHEGSYFSVSYMKGSMPCPVRWMPPENLPYKFNKLSQLIKKPHTKSYEGDVFAFGGALWEFWTRGEQPFSGCDDDQMVCKQVLGGQTAATWNTRVNMRFSVKNIMQLCWKFRPNERPTFAAIVGYFKNLLGVEDSDEDENSDSDLFDVGTQVSGKRENPPLRRKRPVDWMFK